MKKKLLSVILACSLLLSGCAVLTPAPKKNTVTVADLSYELLHTDQYVYAAITNNSEEILAELRVQAVFLDAEDSPLFFSEYHLSPLCPQVTEYAEFYIQTDDFGEPIAYEKVKLLLYPGEYAYTNTQCTEEITYKGFISPYSRELLIHCINNGDHPIETAEFSVLFYHEDEQLCKVGTAYFGPLPQGEQGLYTYVDLPEDWDPETGTYQIFLTNAECYTGEPETCE